MNIPARKKKGPRPQAPGAKLHNDKLHAETQEKRDQALQLRLRSASYAAIGRTLGISETTAARYVADAMRAIPEENARLLKQKEKLKADASELAAYQKLQSDDLPVDDFVKLQTLLLRIRDQRAKYDGHYAPTQHAVEITKLSAASIHEMTDEELLRVREGGLAALGGGPGLAGAGRGGARAPEAGASEGKGREPH